VRKKKSALCAAEEFRVHAGILCLPREGSREMSREMTLCWDSLPAEGRESRDDPCNPKMTLSHPSEHKQAPQKNKARYHSVPARTVTCLVFFIMIHGIVN